MSPDIISIRTEDSKMIFWRNIPDIGTGFGPDCCCLCAVYDQSQWFIDDPRIINWVNVDDEWDMDPTGTWMQTSDTDAELICKTPTPTTAQCISATAGDDASPPGRMRLLGNITVNEDLEPIDYIYAEFDYIAQSVSIGTKSGGVVWTKTGVTISTNDILKMWITLPGCSNKVVVSVAGGTQDRACEDYGWACLSTPGGLYAGLGSGAGGASFDDSEGAFELMIHTDSRDECCDCDCMCEQTCIPMEIKFELTLVGGNRTEDCCPTQEGTMVFDSQEFGGPGPICAWIGSFGGGYYSAYCPVTEFWIYNPSQERQPPVEDIKLVLSDELGGGGDITPHTSSTCCPLYLRYDFRAGWEHPDEDIDYQLWCNYILEITEIEV